MTGQRVVITGAAGGIGRVIAEAFLARGGRVHVCDVDETALRDFAGTSANLSYSVTDVADPVAVRRFIDDAVGELGGIDVLINNVGVAGPTVPVTELDIEAWKAVLDVNLTGTMMVTQAAIPHLARADAASIISLSSLGGRIGYANRSPYAVSKRGILALTETLAIELAADDVRVNAIAPGGVEGDRVRKVLEARAEAAGISVEEVTAQEGSGQPLRGFVDPADIAELAVYLASDAAKSITGQTIAIDNGARSAH